MRVNHDEIRAEIRDRVKPFEEDGWRFESWSGEGDQITVVMNRTTTFTFTHKREEHQPE